MTRQRCVLLLVVCLLPQLVVGRGFAQATAPEPPPSVPCLLTLWTESTVTCYPSGAVAALPALYPFPIRNPVPAVTSMTHMHFRQLMKVIRPEGAAAVPSDNYPSGVYFVFGHYITPALQIPSYSPPEPRWLIVIEDGRYPGFDVPFIWNSWYGGVPSWQTGVETIRSSLCQRGLCASAITNQPVRLVRELLTVLTVTSLGGWRGVYPE